MTSAAHDAPYRLLITGSRDASLVMLDCVQRAVGRAWELNWSIVVGDAPGVDAEVIRQCEMINIEYQIFGIAPLPRNGTFDHYVRCDVTSYLSRDEIMVRRADRVYGIWNGVSRGTKYTLDYARKLNIPVDVATFKAGER